MKTEHRNADKDSLPASVAVMFRQTARKHAANNRQYQRGLCPPKAEAASSNLAGCATLSADFDTDPFALPTAQRDNNAAIMRELARAAMGVGHV